MKKTLALALWVPAAALSLSLVPARPSFERTDLLSDGALPTSNVNPNLINPWDLASSPTGPFWLANARTRTSSIVDAEGAQSLEDVAVPEDKKSGHPTGLVFNGGEGFHVSQEGVSAPSRFIFVGLEGRVLGWSP